MMKKTLAILLLVLTFTSHSSPQILSIAPDEKLPPGLNKKILCSLATDQNCKFFKQVFKLLKKQKYDQLYEHFNTVELSNSFLYWWLRGYTEFKLQKYSASFSSYQKAYTLNDSLPGFLYDYGRLMLLVFNRWESGSKLFLTLYSPKRFPEIPLILTEAALRYQHFQEGVTIFDSLTTLYPNSPDLLIAYASFLNKTGDTLKAALFAREAALYTSDLLYLKIAAKILIQNDYLKDAEEILQKMKKLHRRSADYYEALGSFYQAKKLYPEAIKAYKKSLNYRYSVKTLLRIAEIYLYLDDLKKTRYYCYAILRETTRIPRPYFMLAEIERRKGDFASALKWNQKRIDLNPNKADFHYYQGKLFLELKRYDEALNELKKAVELEPNKQRYRLVLAKTLAYTGNLQEARKVYSEFLTTPLKSLWEEEQVKTRPE